MATGCHAPLHGLGLGDINDGVEEIGLAVLATEVLGVKHVSRQYNQIEDQGTVIDDSIKECSPD